MVENVYLFIRLKAAAYKACLSFRAAYVWRNHCGRWMLLRWPLLFMRRKFLSYLGEVASANVSNWAETLVVGNMSVHFNTDTGAEVTSGNADVFKAFQCHFDALRSSPWRSRWKCTKHCWEILIAHCHAEVFWLPTEDFLQTLLGNFDCPQRCHFLADKLRFSPGWPCIAWKASIWSCKYHWHN